MAWWSGTWERLRLSGSRPSGSGSSELVGDPRPTPAAVQRLPDWPTAAPMPRVIAPHPLIAPLEPFTAALPTRQSPAFLAPLQHLVTPDGGGVVDGLATVAPDSRSGRRADPTAISSASASAAVQRWTTGPELLLAGPDPSAAPRRTAAVAVPAPPTAGSSGDSLVRSADPVPPRALPVVARLAATTADALPAQERLGAMPGQPELPVPRPAEVAAAPLHPPSSVGLADLPPAARSVADQTESPGERSTAAPATDPVASGVPVRQRFSQSEEPGVGRSLADQPHPGTHMPSAIGPFLTVAQRAVPPSDRSAERLLPKPTGEPAEPMLQRSAAAQWPLPIGTSTRPSLSPSLPSSSPTSASPQPPPTSPPRPTVGLGAPLLDVEAVPPAEFAPVAVGFAAFPFGADSPGEAADSADGSAVPALAVARTASDESGPESAPVATDGQAAGTRPPSSWDQRPTLAPPSHWSGERGSSVQRSAVDSPVAATDLPHSPAPSALAGTPVSGVTAPTSTGSDSAGEVAVRAGVAQRATDGSYVFVAPPKAPTEPASPDSLGTSPGAAGYPGSQPEVDSLPLHVTAIASAAVTGAVPTLQRLWGSDALNPGALVDRARDALPIPPTPSLPGSLPSVPALPAVPTVPGLPTVSGLPGVPNLPGLSALPAVPTVPGPPAIPVFPAVADGLPSVPAVGSLPSVPGLPRPPTVPTLAAPALPTVPALPAGPTLPALSSLPLASVLPGLSSPPDRSSLPSELGNPVGGLPSVAGPSPFVAGPNGGVDLPFPSETEKVINSTAPPPVPEPPAASATPPAASATPPAASATPPAAAPAPADGVVGAGTIPAAAAAGAGHAAATPGLDIDDLARRLIDPISSRLRTELWLDRERAGLLTDL